MAPPRDGAEPEGSEGDEAVLKEGDEAVLKDGDAVTTVVKEVFGPLHANEECTLEGRGCEGHDHYCYSGNAR
jgi:hypothetical protein